MCYDWHDYEIEKKKLQELNLTPQEYQQRVIEIAERMGLYEIRE